MDDVHGVDVDLGQPSHHPLVLVQYVIEVEDFACDR